MVECRKKEIEAESEHTNVRLALGQAVVPCAGMAARFKGTSQHKSLYKVAEATILEHILSYWSQYCSDFILVVPEEHLPFLRLMRKLSFSFRLVVQKEPDGVANAVLCAQEYVEEDFVVVLGDCLLRGTFLNLQDPYPGIGVWRGGGGNAISSNYGVVVEQQRVVAVEEKPTAVDGYLCGMGVYFFQPNIFDVIMRLPPTGGKKEVTDLISYYLQSGGFLKPIYFQGNYYNINTVEQALLVEADYAC